MSHFDCLIGTFSRGALIGALLFSGCQAQSGSNVGNKNIEPVALIRTGVNTGGESTEKPLIPDVPETCQSRLQDRICQAMLFHYTFRQSFPRRLEDLIGYEGVRSQVDIRCPVSGKPYIYNPDSTIVLDTQLWEVQGGPDPRTVRQNLRYKVLLYDAEPHGAFRFGIVRLIRVDDAGIEISSFDNPSLYVIPIPEDQFRLRLNLP